MRSSDLIVPTVPASYVLLMLDLIEERGILREELLNGLGISAELLQRPDARISLLNEYAALCRRAIAMTGDAGLACEFGLRATLTTHGILGYGLMSQRTFGDVFLFASRFASVLRMPAWSFQFYAEGPYAIMEGREAVPHGDLRRFSCEQFLVSVSSIVRHLLPPSPEVELLFDYPEPEYHARYRDRLPRCIFSTEVTQIRMPVGYLQRSLGTADMVSAKLAERECERELALLGDGRDLVNQVRDLLVSTDDGYPSMDAVARELHMSTRTFTRRLNELGSSFRELLVQVQKRDSHVLLRDTRLSLTDIAYRLGYSSLANFARAFKTWTGTSPGEFRDRQTGVAPP